MISGSFMALPAAVSVAVVAALAPPAAGTGLLAAAAGFAARRFGRATLPLLAGVVLFYQTAGTLGEWAFTGSAAAAVQDFRIGIPGMLAQAAGGYLIINYLLRK